MVRIWHWHIIISFFLVFNYGAAAERFLQKRATLQCIFFRSSYANKFKECLAIYETKTQHSTHSFELENTFIFVNDVHHLLSIGASKWVLKAVHYDDACDLVLECFALSRFFFAFIASAWKISSKNIFRSKQITITISNKMIKFKCKKEPLGDFFWFAVTLWNKLIFIRREL